MRTLFYDSLEVPTAFGDRTAADLMTPNPVSIRDGVTIPEAAAFLLERGIRGAPVVDHAGRPIGVVSRTDILRHQARCPACRVGLPAGDGWLEGADCSAESVEAGRVPMPLVGDVMTPALFCVGVDTTAAKVLEKMLTLEVRRLFVLDEDGVLVGVVTDGDVLRMLLPLWEGGDGNHGGRWDEPWALSGPRLESEIWAEKED